MIRRRGENGTDTRQTDDVGQRRPRAGWKLVTRESILFAIFWIAAISTVTFSRRYTGIDEFPEGFNASEARPRPSRLATLGGLLPKGWGQRSEEEDALLVLKDDSPGSLGDGSPGISEPENAPQDEEDDGESDGSEWGWVKRKDWKAMLANDPMVATQYLFDLKPFIDALALFKNDRDAKLDDRLLC